MVIFQFANCKLFYPEGFLTCASRRHGGTCPIDTDTGNWWFKLAIRGAGRGDFSEASLGCHIMNQNWMVRHVAQKWAWKFRYGASGYGVSTIYPYLSIDSQKLTNSNMAMGPFILVPYLFVFSTTRSLFTKNTNFPWLVWPQFFFCNENLFSFACETIMFDS